MTRKLPIPERIDDRARKEGFRYAAAQTGNCDTLAELNYAFHEGALAGYRWRAREEQQRQKRRQQARQSRRSR